MSSNSSLTLPCDSELLIGFWNSSQATGDVQENEDALWKMFDMSPEATTMVRSCLIIFSLLHLSFILVNIIVAFVD